MNIFADKRLLLALLGLLLIAFAWFISPPGNFPRGSIVAIEEGAGLETISQTLKENGIIRFPLWFRVAAIILSGERSMQAGHYYFERPESSPIVAWRVLRGRYQIEVIKVTVPEGYTVFDISKLFSENFPFFNNAAFELQAPEGYLFPDTYFLPVTATASTTLKIMGDNFEKKIAALMPEIELSKKAFGDIITMASIIEREANRSPDREIISGILWKRLAENIPLQVDAGFIYVNGESTFELSLEDLKIDSPYNTYTNRGLPPTPIANPGLESIKAALNPIATPYLYFLTGRDGRMYYAKTFKEHVENKRRYLK